MWDLTINLPCLLQERGERLYVPDQGDQKSYEQG